MAGFEARALEEVQSMAKQAPTITEPHRGEANFNSEPNADAVQ